MKNGDDGIRTRDLSVANAALSQLSYVPLNRPNRSSRSGLSSHSVRLDYYSTILEKEKREFEIFLNFFPAILSGYLLKLFYPAILSGYLLKLFYPVFLSGFFLKLSYPAFFLGFSPAPLPAAKADITAPDGGASGAGAARKLRLTSSSEGT